MTAVAVIGLGAMGSRIARRLLGSGLGVVVWNRTAGKLTELAGLGAIPAASPAEAARRADAVITMVSDPPALRDVIEGPGGVAAGVRDSAVVIQMSSVGPAAISWLTSALPPGTGLLDAPVLGSISEAEAGSLRIFVGGPPGLIARWTPLLAVLGSPLPVGPLGAGSAAKLVANATLFGVLGVLGEAVALARGLGLPGATTFEVLATTPLSEQARRRRPSIERGEYPPRFSLSLARKDAGLILDAAAASGVDLRIIHAARSWLLEAEAAGLGDQDYSAMLARILQGRAAQPPAGRERSPASEPPGR